MLNLIKMLFSSKLNIAIFAGIAGVSLSLITLIIYMQFQIKGLKSDLAQSRQSLLNAYSQAKIKELNLELCNANITKQNEALKALRVEGQRLKVAKARAEAKAFKPPPKSSDCKAKAEFYESIFKELSDE